MDPFPSRRDNKAYTWKRSMWPSPQMGRIHSNIQVQKQNCTFLQDLSNFAKARVTLCEHFTWLTLKEAGALQKTGN